MNLRHAKLAIFALDYLRSNLENEVLCALKNFLEPETKLDMENYEASDKEHEDIIIECEVVRDHLEKEHDI